MVAMVQRLDARSFFFRSQLSVCSFLALFVKVFRNRLNCHSLQCGRTISVQAVQFWPLRDNVDQNSLSAVAQAKTVQEKIDARRNCNGIQQSPKSNDSGEKTMAEKTKLVADFISAENVGPNERSEFALGLAVALLLQLSTIEQIQNALATIKGGYS